MNPVNPRRVAAPRAKAKRAPRPAPPSQLIYSAPKAVVDALGSSDARVVAAAACTVEALAHKAKIHVWKFEAAKAINKWPEGAEITEEAFTKAITAVNRISLR